MSFDATEWEAARATNALESRILRFLGATRDTAYTKEEIVLGIGMPQGEPMELLLRLGFSAIFHVSQASTFDLALKHLVEEGTVREKDIRDGSINVRAYRYADT